MVECRKSSCKLEVFVVGRFARRDIRRVACETKYPFCLISAHQQREPFHGSNLKSVIIIQNAFILSHMARNALTKEGQTAPQRALPRITNIYLLFAKLLQIGGIFYAQKQISLVS